MRFTQFEARASRLHIIRRLIVSFLAMISQRVSNYLECWLCKFSKSVFFFFFHLGEIFLLISAPRPSVEIHSKRGIFLLLIN